LRHWQDFAPAGPLPALSALPEKDASGRTGTWRQADVKRAIVAAEQAGLTDYRVEMAPDGTITIVVGPGEAAER
jgi:hypothetical protein